MTLALTFSQELFQTKCVRTAQIIAIFSDFCYFEIKPEMRDVLAKMRECGREAKMRDFPHDCGTVDTYEISTFLMWSLRLTPCIHRNILILVFKSSGSHPSYSSSYYKTIVQMDRSLSWQVRLWWYIENERTIIN